jgi:hypothetical protein
VEDENGVTHLHTPTHKMSLYLLTIIIEDCNRWLPDRP